VVKKFVAPAERNINDENLLFPGRYFAPLELNNLFDTNTTDIWLLWSQYLGELNSPALKGGLSALHLQQSGL
jgi:hypothetical protein